MNRPLRLIAAVLVATLLECIADEPPKYELRGAWLATAYGIDWPSKTGTSTATARRQKADLDSLLTRLSRANINAVFFQVRPMADAFYESSYEPWSSFLTGKRGSRPQYDPLAFCIERCHELGMECHAWINPFRVGAKKPSTPLDLNKSHLWMTNRVKRATMTIFNPAFEETRQYLCDICKEIATKYDIDGIVFDDYFYNPEFLPEDERAADWEDYILSSDGLSIADWRRRNVNLAIADVHKLLSQIKGGRVRFGVSPQGIGGGNGVHAPDGVPELVKYGVMTADSQYAKIYCDPVEWLKEGLIDYISPQIYWPTTNPKHPYHCLCQWWNDVAEMFGRHCFASQTIAPFAQNNTTEEWDERIKQISANRSSSFNNAPGTVFYSASYISGPNRSGFGKILRDSIFRYPALIPPMTWKAPQKEFSISGLRNTGGNISWDAEPGSRFVIYAIPDDIDLLDALSAHSDGFQARYIIGITYSNSFILPQTFRSGYRIAVAPYDRYGNEWQAVFIKDTSDGN